MALASCKVKKRSKVAPTSAAGMLVQSFTTPTSAQLVSADVDALLADNPNDSTSSWLSRATQTLGDNLQRNMGTVCSTLNAGTVGAATLLGSVCAVSGECPENHPWHFISEAEKELYECSYDIPASDHTLHLKENATLVTLARNVISHCLRPCSDVTLPAYTPPRSLIVTGKSTTCDEVNLSELVLAGELSLVNERAHLHTKVCNEEKCCWVTLRDGIFSAEPDASVHSGLLVLGAAGLVLVGAVGSWLTMRLRRKRAMTSDAAAEAGEVCEMEKLNGDAGGATQSSTSDPTTPDVLSSASTPEVVSSASSSLVISEADKPSVRRKAAHVETPRRNQRCETPDESSHAPSLIDNSEAELSSSIDIVSETELSSQRSSSPDMSDAEKLSEAAAVGRREARRSTRLSSSGLLPPSSDVINDAYRDYIDSTLYRSLRSVRQPTSECPSFAKSASPSVPAPVAKSVLADAQVAAKRLLLAAQRNEARASSLLSLRPRHLGTPTPRNRQQQSLDVLCHNDSHDNASTFENATRVFECAVHSPRTTRPRPSRHRVPCGRYDLHTSEHHSRDSRGNKLPPSDLTGLLTPQPRRRLDLLSPQPRRRLDRASNAPFGSEPHLHAPSPLDFFYEDRRSRKLNHPLDFNGRHTASAAHLAGQHRSPCSLHHVEMHHVQRGSSSTNADHA